MTAYAWTDENGVHEAPTGAPFVGPEGASYAANWLDLASPQMRTAHGFKAVVEPDPIPADKRATGTSLSAPGGVPTRSWVLEDIPLADLKAQRVAEINAQRDGLIEGGFSFTVDGQAHTFQSRQSDRENIATMGMLAQLAVAAGAEADDYRWHGGDADFVWITADNDLVTLDAPEMAALFAAGVSFKSAKTFYARALKDAVLAAANAAAVLAVDSETPWP